jgi:hypothetical protein
MHTIPPNTLQSPPFTNRRGVDMPENKSRPGRKQYPKGSPIAVYLGTPEMREERLARLDDNAAKLNTSRNGMIVALADRELVLIDPSVPGAAQAIAATAALRADADTPNPPNPRLAVIAVRHADRLFRVEAYPFEIRVQVADGAISIYRRATDDIARTAHDIASSAWDLLALTALLDRHIEAD